MKHRREDGEAVLAKINSPATAEEIARLAGEIEAAAKAEE